MTKLLQLSLLGKLQITYQNGSLTEILPAKAQALLAYLAMSRQVHSRQALAGLLWGELPEADARRNLRGVLLKLREHLEPYILTTYQTMAFNQAADYWLDVAHFEQGMSERSEAPVSLKQLEATVVLYRGEFLEDFYVRQSLAFEEWSMINRSRLHELALQAHLRLILACKEQGVYEQGIVYGRSLLRLDPTHEEAHRTLMILLTLNGQRPAALAQYELCRETLKQQIGITPDPETTQLYEQIRQNQLPIPKSTPSPISIPSFSIVSPPPVNLASPFIAGPPITQPARFFGREREIKRLFGLLKNIPLQNAAIIGPRRSGKTSLLHYLRTITTTPTSDLRPGQQTQWLARPEQYRWVFVDFQDARLGDLNALLRHLLNQMQLPTPDSCSLDQFLDIVSEQLQNPTVILLDEIGVALERYPQLDNSFWESLRSLATNYLQGQLAFILTAPEQPQTLAQYSGYGSPFFNIFGYTATLGPFTETEAQTLLAHSPLPFANEDVAWMLQESGRWPILLQILGRERLLALEDGIQDSSWRTEAQTQLAPFLKIKDEFPSSAH